MPKLTREHSHHRYSVSHIPVSANLPPSNPNMSFYNPRPVSGYYTDVSTTAPQAAMAVPAYDPYAVAPLTLPPTNTGPLPAQHRASSGAWTVQDDNTLLAARASGQNWSQIQAQYFPTKTGNACRKRHERLMERKGADDWDTRKLERMCKEYMSMRKEIWQGLAARTGERWNVVENKVCSPCPVYLPSHVNRSRHTG